MASVCMLVCTGAIQTTSSCSGPAGAAPRRCSTGAGCPLACNERAGSVTRDARRLHRPLCASCLQGSPRLCELQGRGRRRRGGGDGCERPGRRQPTYQRTRMRHTRRRDAFLWERASHTERRGQQQPAHHREGERTHDMGAQKPYRGGGRWVGSRARSTCLPARPTQVRTAHKRRAHSISAKRA